MIRIYAREPEGEYDEVTEEQLEVLRSHGMVAFDTKEQRWVILGDMADIATARTYSELIGED